MNLHHNDPGLQPERTALSWTRTAVSMALVSMILLRWAKVYGVWIFVLIGLLLGLSATIYFTQRARYRAGVRGLLENAVPPNILSVVILTSGMLVLGMSGVFFVLGT